ncbi:MAG: hypothetical protein RSC43_08530 [Clostridia bacterium]
MNEKLNDLLKKVRASATVAGEFAVKTATGAGKKANEVWSVSKCNLNIFDLNTDVDVLYKDIGKIIYDSHCNVDTPTETLEAKIEEVDSKMGEILALREKIAALKDTKTCDACGAKCEKDTIYCPQCGTKMA